MATKPNKKTTRTRRARKQPATQHDLMVIPRDHIIPFRANVFGLTGRWSEDDHVTVLDPERRPNVGDKVAILWADKARRPEFGYFAAIEYRRRGPRRVQLLKGAASAAAVSPGWFKLGDDDLLAREIGTFIPCKRGGPREEGWPRAYKKLCHGHGLVRTKEQWDLAQVFEVDNPADSPWPGWERLSIDPDAPLGPDDWVAAIEPGATPKKRKVSIGKVAALKRSFEIEDMTTGKRLKLGGTRQPYHGVVIGMSSSVDAFKRSRKATKKVGRRD